MSQIVTIRLERPITSVKILEDRDVETELSDRNEVKSEADAEQTKLMQDLEARKAEVSQDCQALKALIAKLNQFYDKVLAGHKEEIARLSVEIARKVLVQKVQKGDYEIESIIKEALKNAPTRQDLVARLNPEDMTQCQKTLQNDDSGAFAGVKLVADPNIGRAECVLESPKGTIESSIDEHLEQIGKALMKAE